MRLRVLAVRDRAADAFLRPMFVPTVGVGMRAFVDEVNRQSRDNPMYVHPEDYDLYELGGFDEDTGAFIIDGLPRQVAIGKDVVKPVGSTKGEM